MMIDDTFIRIGIFFTILAIMIGLEQAFPARQLSTKNQAPSKTTRLIGNFGLVFISGLSARLALPIGLTGFALYCTEQQWGLFNFLQLPSWLTIALMHDNCPLKTKHQAKRHV